MVILPFALAIGLWFNWTQTQQLARRVQGLPDGEYEWVIGALDGKLFLTSITVNLRTLQGADRFSEKALLFPFLIYRIDAETERAIEQFQSKHWSPVGIIAEREQRFDSWLAQDYDLWVVDSQRNLAYAIKPSEWTALGLEDFRNEVFVIDLKQKQVKARLNIPGIAAIPALALSPDGKKLYVASRSAGKDAIGEPAPGLVVVSTNTLTITKTISLLSDHAPEWMEFSGDGNWLFCGTRRGIAVVDTATDDFRPWNSTGTELLKVDERVLRGLALAPDEREVYVGLRDGDENGAVAAIDIAQEKAVRILELSPTACTSLVVLGNKLFAACLDGVYVIDIDRWRQGK